MKKYVLWIIILIIIIISILTGVFFYYHFKEEKIKSQNQEINKKILIKIIKTGGNYGTSIRLEIYNDKTYKLFNHDLLVRQDNISNINYHQTLDLLNNIDKLKHIQCPVLDPNLYYYTIEANEIKANLGQVSSACIHSLPQNLFNSIKDLDSLTSI